MKIVAFLVQLIAYTFKIILISNCVVYASKCPILSPIHIRNNGSVMPSLKKIRYVAREEKLFQTRVRCSQQSSLSDFDSCRTSHPHQKYLIFFPCCTMYHSPLGAEKLFSPLRRNFVDWCFIINFVHFKSFLAYLEGY